MFDLAQLSETSPADIALTVDEQIEYWRAEQWQPIRAWRALDGPVVGACHSTWGHVRILAQLRMWEALWVDEITEGTGSWIKRESTWTKACDLRAKDTKL